MPKIISYKKPPLVEVVIGLQLTEDSITNEFIISTFYNKYKDRFPKIQEHPALQSIIEKKDDQNEVRLPLGFDSRKFFIEESGNKLVQLQKNRLLFNWRANENGIQYPHYDNVLNEYLDFVSFIDAEIGVLNKVNQLEFTYVDHILVESMHKENLNIPDIFNFINTDKKLKVINCTFNFWEASINGNVIISLKTGKRNNDQSKIYILETTCRGSLSDKQTISNWYDESRRILLDFFEESISNKAKLLWEKEM